MLNVIREYLVGIGFMVDTPSFDTAKKSINDIGKAGTVFADSAVAEFATAGTAVLAFVAAGTAAVAKFTSDMGQLAIQNEIFARTMWMNVDSAVAYKNSLHALGASLQDLYLSPILMKQFLELRQQAGEMTVPGFDDAMQGAQNLTFQFERLKLEGSYSLYWIGYYLTKYLAGPLGNAQNWMEKLNDTITKEMPVWTNDVAKVVSGFERLANAIYLVGKEDEEMWNSLGSATKKVLGIMTGAGAAILALADPFTAMFALMGAFLLMVDDYYTYEQGGQSALPGLWRWIDQMNESLKKNGTINEFKHSINGLAKALVGSDGKSGFFGALWDVINAFDKLINMKDVFSTFVNVLSDLLNYVLNPALEVAAGLLEKIAGAIDKNPQMSKKGTQELSQGGGGLLDFFGGFSKWILQNAFLWPFDTPLGGSRPQNPIPNNNVSINVHVTGASNPHDTATAVEAATKRAIAPLIRYQQGVIS